ncbi:MAG: hypothetical protein CMJ49_05900 [Planctomycetaceae bacterium]|nr:hypothetical protein [Planctomycetaceae bacterium]
MSDDAPRTLDPAHLSVAPHYDPQFKTNWPAFFDRMTAWWHGTLPGPIIRIPIADPSDPPPPLPDDTDFQAHANDVESSIRRREHTFQSTRFLTDLPPSASDFIGHGIASYFGCPLEYRRETVWTHPCLNAIDDPIDVTRWRTDARWLAAIDRIRYMTNRAARRYGVAYYLGGIIQGMSLMRGDEAFLIDLIDHPNHVESLRDRLLPQWFEMADQLEALLPPDAGRWAPFSLWAPGRFAFLECDVSCNFSPDHFRRFVVPELLAMVRWAPYSLYHLDGPGAIHHLDALLEIPELDAIQWIRGDGAGNALDWLDLLQRIQAGGKRLYVECPPDELQPMLDALDPRGLLITVDPPAHPEQLDALQRIASQHAADQND